MVFEPIPTPRLVIRPPEPSDAGALHARRNDPAVAEHQSWQVPFARERADELVRSAAAMDGPVDGEWWMATVCLAATDEIVGDLAVRLTWDGRSAEIGFTFARQHWGQGYALEAAGALVRWLVEDAGVRRVHAMTHPDNVASTMLLERLGMRYEGRTRGSFWVGDECTDDLLYGMTRDDWEAWTSRPTTAPAGLSFVEVTPDNVGDVEQIAGHESQGRFVASVRCSLVDALLPEVVDGAPLAPWYRAVEADGELVAFVMLALITDHHPDPYLWRLLVDRRHQRRGIGSMLLEMIVEQCREWGAAHLLVTWEEGRGSPRPFYEARGFVPTGRIIDEETEARLDL